MATTGRVRLGNLPAELTSFVGRAPEQAQIKWLLADARLVTLTGVGGTGKTRLALRVAADLQRTFRDGVWLVDLAQRHGSGPPTSEVQDPEVLADFVMAGLGVRQRGGAAETHQLAEFLADRQVLLVLDNCEHLLSACARLVHALLSACPALRVLATSREPLSIGGEVLQPVTPLSTPAPSQRPSPADLGSYEAVALFLARASEAAPGWGLTDENAHAVAELCRRLDGLPLAIELAAARIRVLGPSQILNRLTDRFAILSRGSRGAPDRQQTLRACLEWSFDLCSRQEQLLWARLSVFVGGFELDAAEGICADQALPEEDVLDVVAGLVDKSVLIRDHVQGSLGEVSRFRMLETVREFGADRLHEAREDKRLGRRYRDWYRQLADQATAQWISARQGYWAARLTREDPNLRMAIEDGLTEPDEAESTLRLAMSVPLRYWYDRGLLSEVRRWLDSALAQTSTTSALRARALLLGAQLATTQSDGEARTRLLDQGEKLASQLGASVELAYAAYVRAIGPLFRGDLPGAVAALERMEVVLSDVPSPDSGLALELRLGMLTALGIATGDHARAEACFREILEITEPLGEFRQRSYALWGQALSAWRQGKVEVARASLQACLRLIQTSGSTDLYSAAQCVEGMAWVASAQRRYRRAATLLGAVDALRALTGTPVSAFGHFVNHHEACERQARADLGDAAFTEAFARGQALSYDDAVAYAIESRHQPHAPSPVDRPTRLTRREQQVADLIAQGLSNKEIATALVISQRTAENHVQNILAKLGFTSRVQVAAWKAGQQRGVHKA